MKKATGSATESHCQSRNSFEEPGLPLGGRVAWGEQIPKCSSGIYIVTIPDPHTVELGDLPRPLRARWNQGQQIVYIGRSVNLRRRLSQFYRHIQRRANVPGLAFSTR